LGAAPDVETLPLRPDGSRHYYWRPLSADSQLVQLWHFGSKRCALSRHDAKPPFMVVITDAETRTERAFDTHDGAIQFAVDALRDTTNTSAPSDPSS
jgi:hypothetical protein